MLILGLQKMTLLDFPGKIACTIAFPKIGEGGPLAVDEDEDHSRLFLQQRGGGVIC